MSNPQCTRHQFVKSSAEAFAAAGPGSVVRAVEEKQPAQTVLRSVPPGLLVA
ncbi:MAG: hypothetical protein ACODAD_08110 [Planctomycetota bacterium]